MRLDKYLTDFGVGSRSAVKELIKKEQVLLNGETVTRPETKIGPEDVVLVDGQPVQLPDYVYLLMNKPANVLTAMKDPVKPTVADYLPKTRKDVAPVGRLDADTTGALLFTNDGVLNHRLLSPKREVEKVYAVTLTEKLPENAEELLSAPVQWQDITYKAPVAFERTGENSARITLTEGKYHEVKRIFEAVGAPVETLHRVSFAGLTADDLPEGGVRELTEEEVTGLYTLAGL